MKALTLLILVLALCPPLSAQQVNPTTAQAMKERIKKFKNSGRFKVEYDKFKDKTRVKVGPFAISGTARYMTGGGFIFLWGVFGFNGQSLENAPTEFVLMLEHTGKDWEFLRTKEIYFLVDGERIVLDALHDGTVSSRRALLGGLGPIQEVLAVSVDPEIFRKLATGKSSELRAGSYQTKLKEEHQQAFRDLISLASP